MFRRQLDLALLSGLGRLRRLLVGTGGLRLLGGLLSRFVFGVPRRGCEAHIRQALGPVGRGFFGLLLLLELRHNHVFVDDPANETQGNQQQHADERSQAWHFLFRPTIEPASVVLERVQFVDINVAAHSSPPFNTRLTSGELVPVLLAPNAGL
ncbi:hypothetical protein V9K81_28830 (plasmid) [Pseudomonas monteilii]|uniref:hypothetical protein n=1 Tax=Pseudomonas monteilii TaxID=76759 RepID=UPI0030D5BAF0